MLLWKMSKFCVFYLPTFLLVSTRPSQGWLWGGAVRLWGEADVLAGRLQGGGEGRLGGRAAHLLRGGDRERGDGDRDGHRVYRLLLLLLPSCSLVRLFRSLPLDCPRWDYRGKGRAGRDHRPTSVLWVFMWRPSIVTVVRSVVCGRRVLWLWGRENQLLADRLVGRLVDLEGNVDLCVVELLLMVIVLPVGRRRSPQVLLPHVRLDVVAELLPHLAAWPGALVDRLYVLSLQSHHVLGQEQSLRALQFGSICTINGWLLIGAHLFFLKQQWHQNLCLAHSYHSHRP